MCVTLVIYKGYTEMHGQKSMKRNLASNLGYKNANQLHLTDPV